METGRTLIEEFQAQMYKKLKNSVTGYVRFKYYPETDNYSVLITKKGVRFTYKIENVTDSLLNGSTTDQYVESILKLYRYVLINKIFFRQKREDKTYVAS